VSGPREAVLKRLRIHGGIKAREIDIEATPREDLPTPEISPGLDGDGT
jgi:hypothetical protein